MAVGDFWRVRVLTYYGTYHLGINVTHWQIRVQTGVGCTPVEIATALDGTWAALYKAVMSSTAKYRGTGATKIWPGAPSLEGTCVTAAGNGTVAADLLQSEAALIKLGCAVGGRRNRGRMYIPFPAESQNDAGGNPSTAALVDFQTLAAAIGPSQTIIGAGGTVTMAQVVYHRDAPGSGTDVFTLDVEKTWANQRRRRARSRGVTSLPF